MSDCGIIFCGECESLLVDSGYDTQSTLKCSECGNENMFKVGKVSAPSNKSVTLGELISEALKDVKN